MACRVLSVLLLVPVLAASTPAADELRPEQASLDSTGVAVAADLPATTATPQSSLRSPTADRGPDKADSLTLSGPANFVNTPASPAPVTTATGANTPVTRQITPPKHSQLRWKTAEQPGRQTHHKVATRRTRKPHAATQSAPAQKRPAIAWKRRKPRSDIRPAATWPKSGLPTTSELIAPPEKNLGEPPEPGQLSDPYIDPFNDSDQAFRPQRTALASTSREAGRLVPAQAVLSQPMPSPAQLLARYRQDCENTNRRYGQNPITKIGLDITPLFGRGSDLAAMINETERAQQLENVQSRSWRNRDGQALATGKIIDFKHGQIAVQTEQGQTTRIPIASLALEDLAYFGALWGIPVECQISSTQPERAWTSSKFTWRASSTGHKPLYFDEPELERHGHTAGPVLQPLVSGAHFFVNLAMAPYKMGIHPPHECQYALGYERPGNASPWLVPPVPLSLRGALTAGGIYTGGIFVVP